MFVRMNWTDTGYGERKPKKKAKPRPAAKPKPRPVAKAKPKPRTAPKPVYKPVSKPRSTLPYHRPLPTGKLSSREVNWLSTHGWSSAQIARLTPAAARKLIAAGVPKVPGTQTRLAAKPASRTKAKAPSGTLTLNVEVGARVTQAQADRAARLAGGLEYLGDSGDFNEDSSSYTYEGPAAKVLAAAGKINALRIAGLSVNVTDEDHNVVRITSCPRPAAQCKTSSLPSRPTSRPRPASKPHNAPLAKLGRGVQGGVVVECVREGGKIRVKPASPGYDPDMNVQFPRDLRVEGARFLVDDLDDSPGTHYRVVGQIRPFDQGGSVRATLPPAPRHASRKPAAPTAPRAHSKAAPSLLLAHSWEETCDPLGWWISEKLDGVRAYWTGSQFLSREGNVFHAPAWFTKGLPRTPLDGELWSGRKKFQQTLSIVKSHTSGEAWKRVRYLVFDAPSHRGHFEARMDAVEQLVENAPFAQAVKHYQCKGVGHMHHELAAVEKLGGEGLMLRLQGSLYDPKRSRSLLKVKTFHDAEAKVVGYFPGKGKHAGVIGGVIVQMPGGNRFKIGGGFTDAQRRSPPKIGSVITYKYQELSDSGTPRFASFMRVRGNPWW